jgi:hypothetical protein
MSQQNKVSSSSDGRLICDQIDPLNSGEDNPTEKRQYNVHFKSLCVSAGFHRPVPAFICPMAIWNSGHLFVWKVDAPLVLWKRSEGVITEHKGLELEGDRQNQCPPCQVRHDALMPTTRKAYRLKKNLLSLLYCNVSPNHELDLLGVRLIARNHSNQALDLLGARLIVRSHSNQVLGWWI